MRKMRESEKSERKRRTARMIRRKGVRKPLAACPCTGGSAATASEGKEEVGPSANGSIKRQTKTLGGGERITTG